MDTARTITATFNKKNVPPVANNDSATTDEDQAIVIAVLANDTDANNANSELQVSAVSSVANGSVSITTAARGVRYTPAADFHGTVTFTYTVSDPDGATDTAVVTVTVRSVNDAPVANPDSATTDEDQATTINVLGNDSDVDHANSELVVSAVSAPSTGGTASIASAGRSVHYTPPLNFYGSATFTYTVSDPDGATDTATVTITVRPVNDAPVAQPDAATTNEDEPVDLNVVGNDTDVDNATSELQASVLVPPSHGAVTLLGDGQTFRYSPEANYFGTDSFTYAVRDPDGASSAAVVSLEILPVNDNPVAFDDSLLVNEGEAGTVDVLANDRDIDGDAITVHDFDLQSEAGGTIQSNADGTLTYEPPAGFFGTDRFTYDIADTLGATSPRASVVIRVNAFPVALDDQVLTQVGESIAVDVLANDVDPDGGAIFLHIFDEISAAQGTVTLNEDGTLTYEPPVDFHGNDTFTYRIRDDVGALSRVATVTVHVNAAPVAVDDGAFTEQATPVSIPVLANDSDPDADAFGIHTFDAISAGGGQVQASGSGVLIYTPAPGFVGDDRFTYDLADDHGTLSNRATVAIHVNGAPVAVDDGAGVDEDGVLIVDVLANDSDPDGDALTVLAVSAAAHGTTQLLADQRVRYTPAPNFNGTDAFTYTITDEHGTVTAQARVILTVRPVNDQPVAICQNFSQQADGICQAAVSPGEVNAGSTDVDGDALTFTLNPGSPYELGATAVVLTVNDGQGEANSTDTCQATITVEDSAPPGISCLNDPAGIVQVTPDPAITVVFDLPASTDNCTAAPRVECTPAPGDFFPLGVNEVTCTATDDSGNASPCTFTVTVLTPDEQGQVITDVVTDLVDTGVLTGGQGNSLITKIENALDKKNAKTACNQLNAFVMQVNGFVDDGTLTVAEGEELLAAVSLLQEGLGC